MPITSFGVAVTEDFDGLSNTGNTNTDVPVGWDFSESGSAANGQYRAGNGSSSITDTYSFGANGSTERAFGGLQNGSLVPTIGASFTNNTGGTIGILTIEYTGEQWRLGATGRVDRIDFQYSLNATSLTTGNWTDVNALDFTAPVQAGTIGPLDGNLPANQTMISFSITGLNISPGSTFWIRWLDFNASGSDDGLGVDDFSLKTCPSVSCPGDIGLCILTPPFPLTGGSPAGGSYSGQGVSGGNFSPMAAGIGDHEITYAYTVGTCDLSCSFTISVFSATVNAGDYGPACVTDPNILLMGEPPGGNWTGYGVVNGDEFDPNAGTRTLTYTYADANGCSGNDQTTIVVDSCIVPPEMRWVLLDDNGEVHGSCTSQSNCQNNVICFGLQYTPNVSGTLTSYTTGFIIDCNNGNDPVISQKSCVMTTSSLFQNDCGGSGAILWAFSGNTGNVAIMQGVPKILHQVCFVIPNSGSIGLELDVLTDLTTSIDQPGNISISEFPDYVDFSFDSSVYCALLPVTWLRFEASRFGPRTAQLDWATTDEVNNDYFEIQRSNDAGKTFLPVGRVENALHPETVNTYQFFDDEVKPGINYYRLKQYDIDGRFQYSPMRYVRFSTDAFNVHVYPNPVSGELSFEISHADTQGTWTIVDMAGKVREIGSFETGDSFQKIDVRFLPAGIYHLWTVSGGNTQTDKIVIMK